MLPYLFGEFVFFEKECVKFLCFQVQFKQCTVDLPTNGRCLHGDLTHQGGLTYCILVLRMFFL